MARVLFFCWTMLALAACGPALGGTVLLADRPVTTLCTGPQPSETVTLAAQELQTYLGKICGAKLQIVEAAPAGQATILLGPEAVKQAAPQIDLSNLGPEESLLKTLADGRLIVAGRTDLGTLNAAYDLLDLLGCRWFMPGEAGEHVPRTDTLKLPPLDRRFEPSFAHRRIWAAGSRLPDHQQEEYEVWQRRNRMPGALQGSIGHAYDNIVSRRDKKLFAEHPEYFAEVDGRRTNQGQICTTNPDVIARAIEYARRYFRDNPEARMVSFSPNDGGGFCRCKTCVAEGSSSDNALALANKAAQAIENEFPGRYIAFYAYAGTSPPPNLEGRENVIVWIATSFIQGGYTLEQLVQGWSAKVKHIGIRTYYSVTPWTWQMPRYDPEAVAESLRYYHRNKALGVSAESEDNFGSRGVDYYVAARLMYDLNQDPQALLADYYEKCWGAAAPAIRDYWERWRGGPPVTKDRLGLALTDLQRAEELANSDEVRHRIRMLQSYLHYLRLFREYGAAPKDKQTEALGRAITHGYRIQPFHMVMIPNVFYRIVGRPGSRLLDIPEATLKSWQQAPPITPDEVQSDFARDLAEIKPLGIERKTFSLNLVPVASPAAGASSAPAYRGRNQALVLAPQDGLVSLTVTTGLIRSAGAILRLQKLTAEEQDRAELLVGEKLPTTLRAGGPGLYRLLIETQRGSACRLDFGALWHVVVASEDAPLQFIGGSAGPLYFYVPAGTRAFAVGLKTPDGHAQLTVADPSGTVALQEAGDYRLGEEFRVDVPEGQDGKAWSLTISRCEDCSLYLIGAPGYVSQKASALLTPTEATDGK